MEMPMYVFRSPLDRTFHQYIACAQQGHVAGDFEDRFLRRILRRQHQLFDSLLNFPPREFGVARQRTAEILRLLSQEFSNLLVREPWQFRYWLGR
jgi:hypothetical protein